MRHRKEQKKLAPTMRQHKGLMLSMLKGFFEHGKIKTTESRAKELRRLAEHIITVAGNSDIHSRREVFKIVRDRTAVKNIFDSVSPRYTEKKGGYSQIIKLGSRRGDGAPMVLLKLK